MAQLSESVTARLGYAADPAIEILLPKDMLARIKLQKIDMAIRDLKGTIKDLNLQREMLVKEYKLR